MNFQARKENIVVQTANDETMVYDLTVDKAYLLNETSAFVWQMCDGRNNLSEISRALATNMNHPVNEDIVKLAIDQLRENDLLEEPEKVKSFFTKASRRQAIKQVGLATMIVLPTIFSLTAPAAAHAASGQGNIAACQPCTQDNQCASGRCNTVFPNDGTSICNGGTSVYGYTVRPNYNFINSFDSANCTGYGNTYCCSGNGAVFTASPRSCRCRS